MNIRNIMEDMVFEEINNACAEYAASHEGISREKAEICACDQCRKDAACIVLNKMKPLYIVSNRGLVHTALRSLRNRQENADIAAFVYEALRFVKAHPRKNTNHTVEPVFVDRRGGNLPAMFEIPAIVGRLFNGANFEPAAGFDVSLWEDGVSVPMEDSNWSNPCFLAPSMEGTFSFWPAAVPAAETGENRSFQYTIRAEAPGMAPLRHNFEIPVQSKNARGVSGTIRRTYKLGDLYLFPKDEIDEAEEERELLRLQGDVVPDAA